MTFINLVPGNNSDRPENKPLPKLSSQGILNIDVTSIAFSTLFGNSLSLGNKLKKLGKSKLKVLSNTSLSINIMKFLPNKDFGNVALALGAQARITAKTEQGSSPFQAEAQRRFVAKIVTAADKDLTLEVFKKLSSPQNPKTSGAWEELKVNYNKETLINLQRDPNPYAKLIATVLLTGIKSNETYEAIIALKNTTLDRPSSKDMAQLLGYTRTNKACRTLINAKNKTTNTDHLGDIAKALGSIGTKKACNTLAEMKNDADRDNDEDLLSGIAHALGQIGTEEACSTLIEMINTFEIKKAKSWSGLDSGKGSLLRSIIKALGTIETEEAYDTLIKAKDKLHPHSRAIKRLERQCENIKRQRFLKNI
jgi:HEAT repeat protein